MTTAAAGALTYYECHITFVADGAAHRDAAERIVRGNAWKFSAIDGDVVMGAGVKLYATRLFPARWDDERVFMHLDRMAIQLGQAPGLTVLRLKIERVLYDDRSPRMRAFGRCTGGCIECHLDDLTTTEDCG